MEFLKKLNNPNGNFAWDKCGKGVTVAFIGDSVTHGCFECFQMQNGGMQTIFDPEYAYPNRVKQILTMLYPSLHVNIINAGLSGDNAVSGANRLQNDVLSFNPDVVVVSYGLNDCFGGREGLQLYLDGLKGIFTAVADAQSQAIFLTQNVMNDYVSTRLTDKAVIDFATKCYQTQCSGVLDEYFAGAKALCKQMNVPVCDVNSVWKTLQSSGVDVTELLANKHNHPIREMHYYTAIKLVETFLEIKDI